MKSAIDSITANKLLALTARDRLRADEDWGSGSKKVLMQFKFSRGVGLFITASSVFFAFVATADTLRLQVQARYFPGLPVLVRVEKLNSRGEYDRNLWD